MRSFLLSLHLAICGFVVTGNAKHLKTGFRTGVGGPHVPPDHIPRTNCPPGHVVLGPNVPCQDRMSPHRKVPASLSSDGKLGVGPENKAG